MKPNQRPAQAHMYSRDELATANEDFFNNALAHLISHREEAIEAGAALMDGRIPIPPLARELSQEEFQIILAAINNRLLAEERLELDPDLTVVIGVNSISDNQFNISGRDRPRELSATIVLPGIIPDSHNLFVALESDRGDSVPGRFIDEQRIYFGPLEADLYYKFAVRKAG